jgi:hypothetical protein
VGETHAVVSKRSPRLNVIGALLSSGRLLMAKLWQSVHGLWFFGFLTALIARVRKPMVVILDNASIHTAKALEPYWELLQEKGLRFYFLPPYKSGVEPDRNPVEEGEVRMATPPILHADRVGTGHRQDRGGFRLRIPDDFLLRT